RKALSAEGCPHLRGFPRNTDSVDCDEGAFRRMATVIDCHTKAVIGWAADDNYKTPLIEKAIEMAARSYPLAENAIFPPDRGSNYPSCQFAATLRKYGLRHSAGRTGICYDNAM